MMRWTEHRVQTIWQSAVFLLSRVFSLLLMASPGDGARKGSDRKVGEAGRARKVVDMSSDRAVDSSHWEDTCPLAALCHAFRTNM